MKICLINNLYKPYNRGGAERIVELIAHSLQNQGHEVFLITTKPHNAQRVMRNAQQKVYYINALYYNLNFLPKVLRLFWHLRDMFDIGSYFKVKAILKKEKPDVVMTHNLKGIGYLIPSAIKNLEIKHIHTLHDIQLLHPSGLMIHGKENQINSIFVKVYTGICRWLTAGNVKGVPPFAKSGMTSGRLFDSPDTVISPSSWLMKMHTDKGFFKNSRQMILANPAPAATIPSSGTGGEGKFKFFYVGQIEEHKGVLFLIKVFKMLRKELEDVSCELIIAGDGSGLKQAKKLAGDDGMVKFLNKVNHKDLLIIMQKCNILVAPSLCYENSPTVIYEALGVGLPVIASRIGGITELVHKTAGILFKPGNEKDLMYQMKWAIEHGEKLRKIGEIGREKVKKFGVENYIKELEKLIDLSRN
ncbi:MAG: glycosyltransferase [Patescibacteria group bacterium]|nr:glycosyltransferase [Patescibacteria group bacterium]